MRAVPRRLAFRLILALSALVVIVEGGAAYLNLKSQEKQIHDTLVAGMDQISRTVTAATWHAMLADRRADAYAVMESIATRQGVDRIRIFNKDGLITYATDGTSGHQVDKQAEACFLCHAEAQPLVRVDVPSRVRVFTDTDGHRRMGIVAPIYNEPACSNAACHAHPPSQSVLGVLDITKDLAASDAQIAGFQSRSILATVLAVALLCLFIVTITRRLVGAPLRELVEATRAFGERDLSRELRVSADGDLGELARSFEEMRLRLRKALDELGELNHSLEEKVLTRTQQLAEAQARLMESCRLATLGELAATIVHEVNNPVSGIQNLASLLIRILGEGRVPAGREEEVLGYLDQIVSETSRVAAIVASLLSFSRKPSPHRRQVDLNELVERTVSLLQRSLATADKSIRLTLASGLPELPCDPGPIQQVLVNLVSNAAEASPPGSGIEVRTRQDGESLVLVVADEGSGIPEELVPRLYEPFFTTKAAGQGVGLGLAVVYGVVQAHGGRIQLHSAPGQGSTFSVHLPLRPPPLSGAPEEGEESP